MTWLEKYLIAHTNVTCMIVSHDSRLVLQQPLHCHALNAFSRFLDNVTTDIMHYEEKKVCAHLIPWPRDNLWAIQLVYYHGNLSNFVEIHPEAKSYYTLAATSVKFSFPPPGSLMGVRSNTRAILKMNNCTFTYPGKTTPSLISVSCALSLSRFDVYSTYSHVNLLTKRKVVLE